MYFLRSFQRPHDSTAGLERKTCPENLLTEGSDYSQLLRLSVVVVDHYFSAPPAVSRHFLSPVPSPVSSSLACLQFSAPLIPGRTSGRTTGGFSALLGSSVRERERGKHKMSESFFFFRNESRVAAQVVRFKTELSCTCCAFHFMVAVTSHAVV